MYTAGAGLSHLTPESGLNVNSERLRGLKITVDAPINAGMVWPVS